MSIKIAVLKSGEDVIADMKEIRKEDSDDIVAYLFINPLVLKTSFKEEPMVLNESATSAGKTKQLRSPFQINFYPWVPLSATNKISCAADWVVTVVDPIANLKNLYTDRINGNIDTRTDQSESHQESIDFNE